MKIEHLVRCELTIEGMVYLAQLLEAFPLPVVLAVFPTIQDINVAMIAQKMVIDDLTQTGILQNCSCCGTLISNEIATGIASLGTPEITLEGRFFKSREDGTQEILRWAGVKKKNIHTSVSRDESGMLCMDVLDTDQYEGENTPLDVFYPILSGIFEAMGHSSSLNFTPHSIEESEDMTQWIDRSSLSFSRDADPKLIKYMAKLDRTASRGFITLMEQEGGESTITTIHNIEIYINPSGVGLLSYCQKRGTETVRHFTPLTKQYLRQALERILEYSSFDSWFEAYRM